MSLEDLINSLDRESDMWSVIVGFGVIVIIMFFMVLVFGEY